ncbi:MAG: F0F1 ATP synthase subunit B [Bacteroidetes bacterium]|nr:F0F1 ATP synthase subunit B [Bacteroidota bacterium]
MIILSTFDVLKPDPGLFFWTILIFLLFWILVGKFAFKPITGAIKKREEDIQSALDEARKAKTEMESLKSSNEALLQEAREERGKILREAKELKDSIVGEAQNQAKTEASKILADAKVEIESQKNAALAELKNEVGKISLEIAEKVLNRELDSGKNHEDYVASLVDQIKLN